MDSVFRRFRSTPSISTEAAGGDTNCTSSPGIKPVTLYLIRLSPPCRAVWLYLAQNKIPYALVDIDPAAPVDSNGRRPELPSSLPHQDVPILVDGEVTVFEGPAILRYLSTRYTNYKGYGVTVAERMMVASVIAWAHNDLHRMVGYRCAYPQVFGEFQLQPEAANEALIETGIKQFSKYLERLEKRYLASTKFLCGDSLTFADSVVATVIMQSEWLGFSLRLWPRVVDWMETVGRQECWDEVHKNHEVFISELRAGILYPTLDNIAK